MGWLALALLCFGLLLFFLANPGRITRLLDRRATAHGVVVERAPRVVPQGDSTSDFQSSSRGLSRDEPRAPLAGEAGTTEPAVAQPPNVRLVRERAGLAAFGSATPDAALKIVRITPEVVTSPRYALANSPEKPFVPGTWIQVEVEFRAALDLPRETTFRYTLDLGGAVHVGDVTHGPLFAGERLFSVAYLRPRALAPFLRNGSLPSDALRNVRIDVTNGGRLLDSAALRSGAIHVQSAIRGFVVDSSSTPFAPLLGDRYEPLAR